MNLNLQDGGNLELSDAAFARPFNSALVHQVVTAQQAAWRSGSKAQKSRSDRRGGGRKPWRQKGTGRARAGSIRSPIWRGGGVTFAARPRNHDQKVNRKMYRGALCCILSELVRMERLVGLAVFAVDSPKTGALCKQVGALAPADALIVTEQVEPDLHLAARNLPHVEVRSVAALDPVVLISYSHVLITAGALKRLDEALA